jgi:hypothetical protein
MSRFPSIFHKADVQARRALGASIVNKSTSDACTAMSTVVKLKELRYSG